MLKQFEELVAAGRFVEKPFTSMRVKLHVPCQWRCHFCHMEGNHNSGSVNNSDSLVAMLAPLKDRYGLDEIHLTGGEPSIHPQVVEHVDALTRAGYAVKMTTNGQTNLARYVDCINAGLQEVNVSIHTMDPIALGQLMNPPCSKSWGDQAIERQIALCDALRGRFVVKVNTCVGADESEALKIASFVRGSEMRWRIMKVLETSESSEAAMVRLCATLGAVPKRAIFVRGTSSCSIEMATADNFSFSVKIIRPLRLQAMCIGCPVDAEGKCFEFAYGPRVEAVGKQLLVRSCLYRSETPFVLTPQEFLHHQIGEETYDKC
ncbi:MAG: radical SAM protein [Patescibacteria group bacterium]